VPDISIRGKTYDTDLVIFDKDGTLLDFQETWVGIIRELVDLLKGYVPASSLIRERIEKALGLSLDSGAIDGKGALAMGTFSECNALITYCLYREGIRWDRAQDIAEKTGIVVFGHEVRKKHVKAARGVDRLLTMLRSRGINLAVATNDKTADALIDMDLIGASPYLDLVIGADSVKQSKPAPDMVELICSRLGKSAGRAVLVGDTVMDAMLGRNSRVMLTIGVSGIVPAEELAEHTDIVIESLEDIS